MQVCEAKLPTSLPKRTQAWTHQPQPRGFPRTLTKVTKKRKKTATEKPRNPNSKALIDEGLAGSFDDDCWGDIAHFPNIPYLNSILRGYKTEEREQFLTKFDLARNYWYCDQCDYVYKNLLESNGDYILCHGCDNQSHYKCAGMNANSTEEDIQEWKCPKCSSTA